MYRFLTTTLAGLAVSLGVCGSPCAEPGASIAVTGNRHVDSQSIRSYFHLRNEGGPRAEDIDDAVKALYATHLFSDVKVWRTASGVTVKVIENALVDRIAFEGNKVLKDKDLKALIKSKAGGPLSNTLVHDDVESMMEIYRRHGRFNARIVPKIIDKKGRGSDLVYEINEGERTGIREIRFVGNSAIRPDMLRSVIKTGQTNVASFLLDNDFYDPDKVGNDCELLVKYYRSHGYPDAQVKSAVPQYDAVKKALVLTFTIQEGSRFRLGNVSVQSEVASVGPASVATLVETREGDIYNADAIQKTVETLLLRLARFGEPFANITPEIKRVPGRQTVNLVYRIDNGSRRYVERIEIHGNKKTRDAVIRREVGIEEGGPYNPAMVALSERRLKKLGYFKVIKIDRRSGSAPDRVVLDVKVEEEDTGEFTIAGGYSDVDGLIGNVTLAERNLFGNGQSTKLSLDYGQYTRGFNFSLVEPYLFGQKVALGLDLFAKQNESNRYQSYTSTLYGGKISAGLPITDELSTDLHYGLSNQSLVLDPGRGQASIPVQQAAAAGPLWVSTVGSTVTYNVLDDNRHPTNGMFGTLTNDVAGFGGDVKFLRSTADVRYYQPVGEYITSLSRVRAGYITPWGGQTLPLLNGFFGGPQLVRGFAPNGFGPRDITPGTTMDNLGGRVYWATSQELQAPVPFVPPEFQLKSAVFADAGSLWGKGPSSYGPALAQSLQVSNSRAIRSSMGVGLVWDSILGPLRVDYAYPMTKGPYDITQRLHFGFGMF